VISSFTATETAFTKGENDQGQRSQNIHIIRTQQKANNGNPNKGAIQAYGFTTKRLYRLIISSAVPKTVGGC